MAAPSASPLRSLTFPPEILLHILSFASDSYAREHYTALNARNADLASLACVSRAFQEATYSVLYGDLRLAWMGDKADKLHRSFEENSQLLPLVRRLGATVVHRDEWIRNRINNAHNHADRLKQARFDALCEREGIKRNSREWSEALDEDEDEDRAVWEARAANMSKDAKDSWDRNASDSRKREGNQEGACELLDIIASAPALRSLVVRGFKQTLDATDIATRGPYPLIELLVAPLSSASPFFVNHTLSSHLASSTPNLRYLKGHVQIASHHTTPAITLPPSLTRLKIAGYCKDDPRINDLLLQAQPSLRSLTLIPVPESPGWAKRHDQTADNESLNFLAHAIAPSSSLRHLELVHATAALFAALPPSLQSIALLPAIDQDEHPRVEMKRVLELMKAFGTQPLRVEVVAASQWERVVAFAWEECKDAYAEAGHTLTVRY